MPLREAWQASSSLRKNNEGAKMLERNRANDGFLTHGYASSFSATCEALNSKKALVTGTFPP